MSPEVRNELLRVLDRYTVGVALPEDLTGVADKVLIDGTYTKSLGELTYLRGGTMPAIGPVFESAIQELGVSMPDKKGAAFRVVREIATRVVANPEDSLDDLVLVRELNYDAEYELEAASLGYMSYYLDRSEDLWDDDGRQIVDEEEHMRMAAHEASKEAQEWLVMHPEEAKQ